MFIVLLFYLQTIQPTESRKIPDEHAQWEARVVAIGQPFRDAVLKGAEDGELNETLAKLAPGVVHCLGLLEKQVVCARSSSAICFVFNNVLKATNSWPWQAGM